MSQSGWEGVRPRRHQGKNNWNIMGIEHPTALGAHRLQTGHVYGRNLCARPASGAHTKGHQQDRWWLIDLRACINGEHRLYTHQVTVVIGAQFMNRKLDGAQLSCGGVGAQSSLTRRRRETNNRCTSVPNGHLYTDCYTEHS